MNSFLLLALLLQATSRDSVADVKVEDREETYKIEGSSARELWDQIHRVGPLDKEQGKRVAGHTKWQVVWEYSLHGEDKSCKTDAVHVSVSIVVTLPEWTTMEHGDSALRAKWPSFIAKLREHEAGHRQNGLLAAEAVRRVFTDVVPQSDCKSLGDQLDSAAHVAVARYNQVDIDYDAATEHGVKQGASL